MLEINKVLRKEKHMERMRCLLVLLVFAAATLFCASTLSAVPTGGTATYMVAASNASDAVKARADYVCDGVADQVEIQAAIDAIFANLGHGNLHLSGYFSISAPIDIKASLYGSLKITGDGIPSTLIALANNSNCTMLRLYPSLGYVLYHVTIEGISFSGNRANQIAGDIIDLSGMSRAHLVNVEVSDAYRHCLYAVATNDISLVNVTASGASSSAVVQFTSCDGITGTNVYIYKYSGLAGIGLGISGGSESAFTNLIVDGGSLNIGISLYAVSRLKLTNFWVGAFSEQGLYITYTSTDDVFSNGTFYARGTLVPNGHCIYVVESVNNIIFSGLSFDADVGGGVNFVDTTTNNLVTNCNFSKIDTAVKKVVDTSSGTNTVKNNIGYVTENSGAATIVNGQTTVNVTHNLAATPTRVLLTPTTDTLNRRYWISAKNATTFSISINSSAVSNITFDWRAVVGEGN